MHWLLRNTTDDPFTNLKSSANTNLVPQISLDSFMTMKEFQSMPPLVTEPEDVAEILMDAECQMKLLQLGYTVHIEVEEGKDLLDGLFCFEDAGGNKVYPQQGCMYNKTEVLSAAKITNSQKSHPPCRSNSESLAMNAFVENCECRNDTDSIVANCENSSLSVTLYGSGGAAKLVGETCEPSTKSALNPTNESWATMASAQCLASNASMTLCCGWS